LEFNLATINKQDYATELDFNKIQLHEWKKLLPETYKCSQRQIVYTKETFIEAGAAQDKLDSKQTKPYFVQYYIP